MKVHVTGEVRTVISRKDGRKHSFSTVFVFTNPSLPYPEKVQVYGALELPAGLYEVPLALNVNNERLGVSLDFSKAEPIEK